MNKAGIALAVFFGAVLALAIYYAATLWLRLADIDIGMHGWIALVLGASLTTILGVGLMFLVFYSNRKGYDEIERE
jgi:hypothetical protein